MQNNIVFQPCRVADIPFRTRIVSFKRQQPPLSETLQTTISKWSRYGICKEIRAKPALSERADEDNAAAVNASSEDMRKEPDNPTRRSPHARRRPQAGKPRRRIGATGRKRKRRAANRSATAAAGSNIIIEAGKAGPKIDKSQPQ